MSNQPIYKQNTSKLLITILPLDTLVLIDADHATRAIKIILTGIDNDTYSTVDACPSAMEMWKAIERLKQGESINVQDFKTNLYWEFGKFTSRDGKTLDLYYSRFCKMMSELKIYKPTNNNLRTSSNTKNKNVDNTLRSDRRIGYDKQIGHYENQRAVNVVGARDNVGTQVVQQSGIQCFNYKEFRHVARECKKAKRVRDSAYHKEKMLMCKQEEDGIQLTAKQVDWRDNTYDEPEDHEFEAQYVHEKDSRGEVDQDIAEEEECVVHLSLTVDNIATDVVEFYQTLIEELVADLRYFNSLEKVVEYLQSQLELQQTQFINEIDRLSREYYYADHINVILGVYTDIDEYSEMACNYLEALDKCERLENEISKRTKNVENKSFHDLSKSLSKRAVVTESTPAGRGITSHLYVILKQNSSNKRVDNMALSSSDLVDSNNLLNRVPSQSVGSSNIDY
ncbi:hypothetical protein Tco_0524578 [Tanacetum coccineum]